MALSAPTTWEFTLVLTDRDNNKAPVSFFAPAAVILGDLETFITGTLIPNVEALSDAVVTSYHIGRSAFDYAPAQAPETSDVERKGVFSFRVDGGGILTNQIPSIKNTLVVDGSNLLNPADAAVTTFIAMMTDTGLLDVYGMGNFRGDALLAQSSPPHKIHKKSNKG